MPPKTCEEQQGERKSEFKTRAAQHMGICAGLGAASLTVQAATMGPEIGADIAAVGAKAVEAAKALRNLSKVEREIKDMEEIVEVGETLTLLEEISSVITGIGNTRKVSD